jgi:hypothetical protein
MNKGSFNVSDQTMIGKAQNDPEMAQVTATIGGENMDFDIPIRYKSNDPVKGEVYEPLFVIPKEEVRSDPEIALSINDVPVGVKTAVTRNGHSADDSTVVSSAKNVRQVTKGKETYYSIKDATKGNTESIDFSTGADGKYNSYKRLISYPHIPDIIYFHKAETRLVEVDLKTAGKKAGYIPGAGDKVPDALQKMGYEVTILGPKDMTPKNLAQFDAIVTGVRAYNIFDWLDESYGVLMDYVRQGGVLLVQYNTNNNIGPVKAKIGPYPFTISRNRVTDENAEVRFLHPENVLMNYPNKITQKDFDNWIQERSTYHAINYGADYKTLFSMHDQGEGPQDGSLIYTDYGKGRFIYCGLVFFRELPAGVPGAYRLMANLLAKPEHK